MDILKGIFARAAIRRLGRLDGSPEPQPPPEPLPPPARRHPLDAWLDAVPDDPYDVCPCGCGMKWRFVLRGGEAEIKKHAETFMDAQRAG